MFRVALSLRMPLFKNSLDQRDGPYELENVPFVIELSRVLEKGNLTFRVYPNLGLIAVVSRKWRMDARVGLPHLVVEISKAQKR